MIQKSNFVYNVTLANPNLQPSYYYKNLSLVDGFSFVLFQKNKVATIDGYTRVGTSEKAVLCATVQQPVSVYVNATDFQFYSGVSILFKYFVLCAN